MGCGNVGSALAELLVARQDDIAVRTGIRLELVGIAVARYRTAPGQLPSPASCSGPTGRRWWCGPDVDVVVELIGGIHPAHELISAALRAGKPVVTANKAVLAASGAELAELAATPAVSTFLYEAAVAGAIPVIRPLRESLAGEQIVRIMGIVNGTTNFILTRMEEDGVDFDDALAEAQRLGLAERDPTADVDGHDAAAKAAILAALAFGSDVVDVDVHREGIRRDQGGGRGVRQSAGLFGEAFGGGRIGRRRSRALGKGAPGNGAKDAPIGFSSRVLQRGVR